MNLRRNNRSGRHFLPEADVQKYYIGGRAGLAPGGDRGGPGLRTEGALASGRGRRERRPRRGPGAPLRGDGAAGRAGFCGREVQEPVSRGGQRR